MNLINFLIKFMESYRNFEICDQCTQFRELTDNNFHKEADEFSECGCCLDLDELETYKKSVIKIENWYLAKLEACLRSRYFKYKNLEYKYCIGCEDRNKNAIFIGTYPDKVYKFSLHKYVPDTINIFMCKNCIKEINSSCSEDSQDSSCYNCTNYGRCYDCELFNPVFDTWGLPRGYTKMSSQEIRRYRYL